MRHVLDRLNELPFFGALDDAVTQEIARAGRWYSIAGGWPLFEQGAPAERLHFLLSGRLIVVRKTQSGEDDVVGYVRSGEPVGEMSILSGEPHSASVYALRDSEILSIDRETYTDLLEEHGDLAAALARLALSRARRPKLSFNRSAPRIFALIGASRSIDVDEYARTLADLIAGMGMKAKTFPVSDTAPDSFAFDREEEEHDVLVLAARVEDTSWYRFVLRHADRFLVLARRDARPPRPFPMATEAGARARKFRLVDLVMIHEGVPACPIVDWIDAISAARVFHCRSGACLDRLARIVAGRSVGIVLSGGGARAYAHIGVIKALREKGISIDLACGASMGGIIAACAAMGWDDDEIEERIRDAFVESNPLGDHVLPVVALTRGKLVEERLKRHFGDALIEDIELPFFCVSSELTEGAVRIHRRGLLRDALRASISLPGILPPVVANGSLLVDGAVMNNFPTDIMTGMHRGATVGVDVARRGTIEASAFDDPPGFFSWVRKHGLRSAPPIVTLLMRSASARREDAVTVKTADIMITPAVTGVGIRDWKRYDQAVEDGYETAMAALETHLPDFFGDAL
ncbi:MAG: patatin-like phospholipase family protein [Pseudomonadota bacterium]